nr:RNA polymerase sigma-70 factor [Arachidicoccus sp. BS20]
MELLSFIAKNDETAFNEIYNRHWASIYGNAMKILKSESDAEDVVQEVFSTLWQKRNSIVIKNTLAGYLYMVARYISLRIIEKNIEKYTDITSMSEYYQSSMITNVESNIDLTKMEFAIEKAINSLPKKMREIFNLSRKNNLTHRQIAEKLNISEGTVKKQVYNALKIIKEHLNDKIPLILIVFYVYDIVF